MAARILCGQWAVVSSQVAVPSDGSYAWGGGRQAVPQCCYMGLEQFNLAGRGRRGPSRSVGRPWTLAHAYQTPFGRLSGKCGV